MSGAREVDDGWVNGAHAVERIVFEIICHFRSVGRDLIFDEVEVKLLNELEKLRLPAEKLEKEKGQLRERLESLGSEKCALEVELRKMRDCVELSGVFSRLGWSDGRERSAEEIYKVMLSKLMSGNGEDLSKVVEHLRGKVEELERDSWDVGVLRRRMERLESENADLKRKGDWGSREVGELRRIVKELEVENVELRRKGEQGSREVGELRRIVKELEVENVELRRKGEQGLRDVGEMNRKMEEWEKENTMLRRKVEGGSRDALELRKVKEELALANAKLNVREELTMANVKLKVKAEGNSLDFIELSRKAEVLEAENKDLKANLEQNVAKLRRTEDTELLYVNLKRELDECEKICKDLKNEKGILERKNEVMQSDLDKLTQKNEKLEKKISWWKMYYEELDKRVIILEKDVIELKSCDEGILGHEDGRKGPCTDEKLDSRSKNGKTCYAEIGVGNGKHGEVIGTVLSAENRRNDGVHSAALSTGNTTPISGELVDLMDSDDDTAFAGCSAKNKHSQNTLDKELPLSSTRELKRKSSMFIDLTENEDNKKNGDDFCRSSSWMANNKRSNLGLGEKLDRSPRSSGSSFVPPPYCSQVLRYSPGFRKDGF